MEYCRMYKCLNIGTYVTLEGLLDWGGIQFISGDLVYTQQTSPNMCTLKALELEDLNIL